MSIVGLAVTRTSIATARMLRPFPALLRTYLPKAYDYIDWRWSETTICKTKFGLKMRCRLNDLIQRRVAYFGVWEPSLTNYFRRSLEPGDVVIDVGANIGYFSLLASQLVGPNGAVIAIEASPSIYALLCENIALNAITNVRAVNCAAAYEEGEMSLYAAGNDNIGSSSTIPIAGNKLTGKVKALPLHAIATAEELARVRLIKIDIEGAEQPVIRSILENLSLYNPSCEIALEVAVASNGVLAEMISYGFKAYELHNDNSDKGYIGGLTSDPKLFIGTVDEVTDFIFSRRTPCSRN